MFLDGLEDAYEKGKLMGSFAEDCAEHYQFSRTAQDDFALRSLGRAQAATQDGKLAAEICPITIETKKGCHLVDTDEQPQLASLKKISLLKPAFRENGTVTAANSSSISDGAAALCLASGSAVQAQGLSVRARICGHAGKRCACTAEPLARQSAAAPSEIEEELAAVTVPFSWKMAQ